MYLLYYDYNQVCKKYHRLEEPQVDRGSRGRRFAEGSSTAEIRQSSPESTGSLIGSRRWVVLVSSFAAALVFGVRVVDLM